MTAFFVSLHAIVTRLLLPPEFYARFGIEIRESFAARLRERPARARLHCGVKGLADVAATAAAEWWRVLRRSAGRASPWRDRPVGRLGRDLRFAWRSLARRPGFALAVVATLALGIGANTAVFALIDAVLLRPLPITDPDRVVNVFGVRAAGNEVSAIGLDGGLSYAAFRAIEADARLLSGIAGFIDVEVGLQSDVGPRQLTAGAVSGRYFDVLGVAPAVGRLITASDDVKGAAQHVVVLSDRFWRRELGADRAAVGRVLQLGGRPYTIVGVAPPGFRGTRLSSAPEIWVPLTTITDIRAGGIWRGPLGQRMLGDHPLGWVGTVARLRDGVTASAAAEEIGAIVNRTTAAIGVESRVVDVAPVVEAAAFGDRRAVVRFVWMLAAVAGATLLIACLNIANLVAVTTAERRGERALRMALGAGRIRLFWDSALEYFVLVALASAAALFVGLMGTRALAAMTLPGSLDLARSDIGLTMRMAIVTIAVAAISALVIAVAPVLRRRGPAAISLRGHGPARTSPTRGWLVSGQVALTLVLLTASGLFVRSLRNGLETDLGFRPESLAAVSVDLFRYGYDAPRATTYYAEVLARAAALPGVKDAALTTHMPLAPVGQLPFDAPGGPHAPDRPLMAGIVTVSEAYFAVLGVPTVAGRVFDATDRRGAMRAAVINESAARALFAGAPAVGREIRMFGSRPSTVVGVVADGRYTGVRDVGRPVVYQAFAQETPTGGVTIVARSDRTASTLPFLRQQVAQIDPTVALYAPRLIEDQVAEALAPQRTGSLLLLVAATIALGVAAIGIYSVIASTVGLRRAEIGIRLALGASSRDVVRAVSSRTGTAILVGFALGAGLAVPAGRALERFLLDVPPLDPLSLAIALTLLSALAIVALLLPARKALKTDPVVVLRGE